ncbi:MAG: hypothetical protein M3014_15005 [Chloroflexota bacterium]|nr:hypothetical protein [Chloroflexota bacterium]
MAQKLHNTYGFSYDKLQVLLGGWSSWQQDNGTDATHYPIETSASATGSTPNPQLPRTASPAVVSPGSKSTPAPAPGLTPNLAPAPVTNPTP